MGYVPRTKEQALEAGRRKSAEYANLIGYNQPRYKYLYFIESGPGGSHQDRGGRRSRATA